MAIAYDNESGVEALQAQLPGWILDPRTLTWLWMWLRVSGAPLTDEEERDLAPDMFMTKAMFLTMADRLGDRYLVEDLSKARTVEILPMHDLSWIEKNGRQITWLVNEFEQIFREDRVNDPVYPSVLNSRERLIAMIDYWRQPISEKQRVLNGLRDNWVQHLRLDEYYKWFKEGSEKQKCEVAWDWYCEKYPRLMRSVSKFVKLDDLLSFLDSSNFSSDKRQLHIGEIKKELKRRQSRKNLEGKSQTNLALSDESRHQLDFLVKQQRMTMVAIVERLIQHAARYGMPDETDAVQQTSLF
ncbi:hypothetical protein ACFPTO_01825 [Paraburkholderia denitrificans]|uniref:Uncharacterized protein n=1 Tax=Paraburkholderia denitrificans TaxID=694025 RepID=A0ABW0J3E0_9BURK